MELPHNKAGWYVDSCRSFVKYSIISKFNFVASMSLQTLSQFNFKMGEFGSSENSQTAFSTFPGL